MSFGFGIGDFFQILSLAYNVHQRCKASTAQFQDIGREVGNTHIIMQRVHAFWKSENDHGQPLLIPQQDELKEYTQNCEEELQKLEVILKKHESLATASTVRARASFAWKDFIGDIASIRGRLQSATGALAVFHTILTGDALARYSHNQDTLLRDQSDVLKAQAKLLRQFQEEAQILSFFVRSYQEFQNGTRAEPAFSQTSKQADQLADKSYLAAGEELRAEGVTDSAIRAHHVLIKRWIDTVILAPSHDGNEDTAGYDADGMTSSSRTVVNDQPDQGRQSELSDKDRPQHRAGEAGNAISGQYPSLDLSSVKSESAVNSPVSIIPRSQSVATHRSQSSTWEVPDMRAEVGSKDYASIMIAKVLRSKYPPQPGDEHFRLPVKRAFHFLDWTSRGWLTRAQVEKSCIDAAGLTGWTFGAEEVAKVVILEDSKEDKPDHRIDPEEFFNIVMTIRDEIKKATIFDSNKAGLVEGAAGLWSWFWSKDGARPHSDQWHFAQRQRITASSLNTISVYSHDLVGDLPDFVIPLRPNLTNAIFLATRFSTRKLDAAMNNWQAELRKLPSVERAEYTQALNNVVEATTVFHQLQETAGIDTYHAVDESLDSALLIPLHKYEGLKAYPLSAAESCCSRPWEKLPSILGFVRDLGFVVIKAAGPLGTQLPDLKRWRKLRMLDRSQEILESVPGLQGLVQTVDKVRNWCSANLKELKKQYEDCVSATLSLRNEQETAAQEALLNVLGMTIQIDNVPHPPFRKPTTHLIMQVDDKSVDFFPTKSSNPRWSNDVDFKKSSTFHLDFYDCVKDCEKHKLLGSVEFRALDTVDFARSSPVNFKRPIRGKDLVVDVTVQPRKRQRLYKWQPTNADEIEQERLKLPLQVYVLAHPLPSQWEVRRNDRDDGIDKGMVYFENTQTRHNTVMLWFDPLADECPDAPLEPLPAGWKREAREGQILYRDQHGKIAELPMTKDGTETFENVLQNAALHQPWAFHISK